MKQDSEVLLLRPGAGKKPKMPELLYEVPPSTVQESQTSSTLYRINPLEDPRWDELLERHPKASVFHSRAWLEALRKTYGYEPAAYTTSPSGESLKNGIVFCRVESWLTGRRLVSLPFSDYCAPLVDDPGEMQVFLNKLKQEAETGQWRYIEIRPTELLGMTAPLYHATAEYTLHRLDLRPNLQTIFDGFHRDSIQRKIHRAKREGLTSIVGTTESLLDAFYRLLVTTRRRHGVPPQPKRWFRNLIACFGEALQIGVAFKGHKPVAAMLTLRYKDTLLYKYGGSDTRFNNLGSMHHLYWESIQRAKSLGLRVFDLGRSDAHQGGLIRFKSRWGALQSNLTYLRLTPDEDPMHMFEPSATTWRTRAAKSVFAHAPAFALPAIGNLLYKHIG
jgi:lipid II:glycine glycyltransferase (peptidoglycan interpeptide bridge formation enzyme)